MSWVILSTLVGWALGIAIPALLLSEFSREGHHVSWQVRPRGPYENASIHVRPIDSARSQIITTRERFGEREITILGVPDDQIRKYVSNTAIRGYTPTDELPWWFKLIDDPDHLGPRRVSLYGWPRPLVVVEDFESRTVFASHLALAGIMFPFGLLSTGLANWLFHFQDLSARRQTLGSTKNTKSKDHEPCATLTEAPRTSGG